MRDLLQNPDMDYTKLLKDKSAKSLMKQAKRFQSNLTVLIKEELLMLPFWWDQLRESEVSHDTFQHPQGTHAPLSKVYECFWSYQNMLASWCFAYCHCCPAWQNFDFLSTEVSLFSASGWFLIHFLPLSTSWDLQLVLTIGFRVLILTCFVKSKWPIS